MILSSTHIFTRIVLVVGLVGGGAVIGVLGDEKLVGEGENSHSLRGKSEILKDVLGLNITY